jgi:predicted AlkP superfamily pyrophosphatase or phosphodiesterase
MKRIFAIITVLAIAAASSGAQTPKLVIAIAVDQFRYDYLLRFRSEYKQGLDLLLTHGAVFTNAYYQHFPTVTAIGHSTFLTGATPAISGIVANDWFDRETGKSVTSVSDDSVKILGGAGEGGASPHRLLVSTVGDELKISDGAARV